jgi:hypothetical protein
MTAARRQPLLFATLATLGFLLVLAARHHDGRQGAGQ